MVATTDNRQQTTNRQTTDSYYPIVPGGKSARDKNVTDFQKAEIFAMAPDSMAPERRSADSAIF